MLASDIINLAKNGELKQLAVAKDDSAILGFINLGVLEIYKRFPLREEEAIITLTQGKTRYVLDGTDSSVSMGSPDSLLQVTECYDEQGDLVNINDENDILGIMVPFFNVVEVPNIIEGERLSVIYRASPEFVKYTTDIVHVPPQLLEALLHYIGYKGHSSITSDVKSENNSHYIRFDKSCNMIINQGLHMPDDLESYTFNERGFT